MKSTEEPERFLRFFVNHSQRAVVQNPHFFAPIGMSNLHWGHFSVVGAAAGAGASRFSRLICLIIKKIANATIKKLTIVLKNTP